MKTPRVTLLTALMLGGAVTAQAMPLGESASVGLFIGDNTRLDGAFDTSAPHVQAVPGGEVVFNRIPFDDAYEHRLTGGAELDVSLAPQLSGYARAAYSQFDGRQHEVGAVFAGNGRVPVDARFADDHARSLDLGARYLFAPESRLRPFLGLAVGVSDLAPARATVTSPEVATPTRVELAKGGTVFEQRVEAGLQFSPLRNVDLRLTAAADHEGAQKASDDPNLALLGLSPSRAAIGTRWSYPAELGAVWHF